MRQELENLVRNGQFNRAAQMLRELKTHKIPRADAAVYAGLARRVGLPALSIKILNPILRGKIPSKLQPTHDEKIQYASSLRQLGAISEAIDLLQAVDQNECPQTLFELALCEIHQWRYRSAIHFLESYLSHSSEPPYRLLVAKVNLFAALTFEGLFAEATRLMDGFSSDNIEQYPLLFGNVLEISAQLEIKRKNWRAAFEKLEKAKQLLAGAPSSIHSLLIEKWWAIALSLKAENVTPELQTVRENALQLQHWETIRDCDYYSAVISGDVQLMTRVYFGTPYESFRSRAVEAWGGDLTLPQTYSWNERKHSSATLIFDLKNGAFGDTALVIGQAMHRLMIILCRDFYKPVPIVSAFSQLFPGEYFNPDSSPNRVHQVIKRLRLWFKESSLPLELEEISSSYRLRFKNFSFAISVPQERLPDSCDEIRFLSLRGQVSEVFSANEAQKILGDSSRNTGRLLQWAAHTGRISICGGGRSTRYKLVG